MPHRQEPSEEDQRRVLRSAHEKAASSHHRLPQFYLRGFAGKNGRLDVADRSTGRRHSRAPSRAFAEEAYYTVSDQDEQPMALAEVLYEALEDKAARLHRRLLEGESPGALDRYERSDYCFFLAAQWTRGEAFRSMNRRLADTMGKQLMRAEAERIDSWWPDFVSRMQERGEELPDVTPEEYRDFVLRDEFDLVPSPEATLEASLGLLPDLAGVIFDFAWHTVHLPKPMLWTHEEPLSLWRPPSAGDRFLGIGLATSDEIRIALSPTCALVMTHPRFYRRDRTGTGSRRTAAWINYWTYRFRPEGALVLCPDVAFHPFPMADLLEPRFMAGPIITY